MQSLRVQLKNWIQTQGYVSYQEICNACISGKFGRWHKVSAAERRMRELTSPKHPAYTPSIVTDGKGKYGYIRGYKWDSSVKTFREEIKFREMKVMGSNGEVEKILKMPI